MQSPDIIVTKENYQASTGFNGALLGAVPSQSPARFAPARPASPAAEDSHQRALAIFRGFGHRPGQAGARRRRTPK